MRQKVRQWDKQLKPSGLSVQILLERPDSGSMIVYVYRRKQLERILEGEDYRAFLTQMGYVHMDLDSLLAQLALRLETQPEFLHEIGVFPSARCGWLHQKSRAELHLLRFLEVVQ